MSTFNGYVNEFPDIRIDFFRNHADRSPPQACFLSHVHSDHLQGLESLKMPFVYCSLATKKILLKLEKYPHRINFAKGILEARKLTYKSLKLILRALPLETSIDIELSPKTKIRVTLFDANHCPGAVMFLIESGDKAILYTGDVRAEPWWVNSIVRNPLLLPYSCGAKRFDCVYLDTTFASRHDIHEAFPTKADGLRELIVKIGKCPQKSIIYFRSWTFGYEDVWITLSKLLQSPVHVDKYQLRVFQSLSDDTNNVDRGPALAGFSYGNQSQPGCLTNDSSVLIHSCEPGTECYENIRKRKDVVWITPIISRSKDGTEIKEVGAGGGGGDLYQTPQLELLDEPTLSALEKLCAGNIKYAKTLERLQQKFSTARAKGDLSITLEGLDLDQEQEVTLKRFIQLMSSRDESEATYSDQQSRIIHFPYSRHSSFSELRHLVSCFKPKDICPCTVDLETWSEEVSMQDLFGDLCSENVFRHDREIRERIRERNQLSHGQKRKRGQKIEKSARDETQDSIDTEGLYVSAETSIDRPYAPEIAAQAHQTQSIKEDEMSTQVPTPIQRLHQAVRDKFDGRDCSEARHRRIIIDISDSEPSSSPVGTARPGNRSNTTITSTKPPPSNEESNLHAEHSEDSETSVPSYAFASGPASDHQSPSHNQSRPSKSKSSTSRSHQQRSNTSTHHDSNSDSDSDDDDRLAHRIKAYHAAKSVLVKNDPGPWQDLRLRSLGWPGHTEEEILL